MTTTRRTGLRRIPLAIAALSLALPGAAAAATIAVDTTADDLGLGANGSCSLREAVIAANVDLPVDGCTAGSGTDTIVVPAGTYDLTLEGRNENVAWTGDLDLTWDVVIQGAGADVTIIDAGGLDRVFEIIKSPGDMSAELHGLTIRGGVAVDGGFPYRNEGDGGGIRSWEPVLIADCVLEDNHTELDGGAVYMDANAGQGVRLERSVVRGNSAELDGGGLWVQGGEVIDSVVEGNTAGRTGGGVKHGVVLRTTVRENYAEAAGGGISEATRVEDSLVEGNETPGSGGGGGGIQVISGSTFAGNVAGVHGGGISNFYEWIENSTFSGNRATAGGGIYYATSGWMNNVTVTENVATERGGGIVNTLTPVQFVLSHGLVAGNEAPEGPDCLGSFTSLGANLIGDGSDCEGFALVGNLDQVGTSADPIDPLLGALADNGGPTPTHALLTASPAIDGGFPPEVEGCAAVDQRGAERPQGPRCDIGAYERNALGCSGAISATPHGALASLTLLVVLTRARRRSARTRPAGSRAGGSRRRDRPSRGSRAGRRDPDRPRRAACRR